MDNEIELNEQGHAVRINFNIVFLSGKNHTSNSLGKEGNLMGGVAPNYDKLNVKVKYLNGVKSI